MNKNFVKIIGIVLFLLTAILLSYQFFYLSSGCIQVLVSATHRFTGEVKTFGDPCSVPFWYKDVRAFNPVSTIIDEAKVYSVKEALSILATSPDNLKNKQIKIQALHADSIRGTGCNDYRILMDKEDAERSTYLKDILTRAEMDKEGSERIRKEIQGLPLIKSGETLIMRDSGVYPTEYGIYQGHFYDSDLSQKCPQGETKFVIDKKLKEIK